VSHYMTLLPGDIIATGTPPGVGLGIKPTPVFLKPGDVMTLRIQGLGEQRQKVVAYAPRAFCTCREGAWSKLKAMNKRAESWQGWSSRLWMPYTATGSSRRRRACLPVPRACITGPPKDARSSTAVQACGA